MAENENGWSTYTKVLCIHTKNEQAASESKYIQFAIKVEKEKKLCERRTHAFMDLGSLPEGS